MSTDDDQPLVSIVTPSYNYARFIEETILSVKNQTYPHVEHIIMDGGSDDGTVKILEKHEGTYDMEWSSEPDEGMYEAIEKGFEKASGEILAWLNADDRYLPWAASKAVEYITGGDHRWVTGVPAFWDLDGRLSYVSSLRPYYKQSWIKRGWYRWGLFGPIQQESCFWTRDLWDQSGGFPDGEVQAGDFHLWRRFAEHADLFTIPTVLSGFRRHEDQRSSRLREEYEADLASDWFFLGRILAAFHADDLYSLIRANAADIPPP